MIIPSQDIYPPNVVKRKYSYALDLAWHSFAYYIRVRDNIATTNNPANGKCITCEMMRDRKGTVYMMSAINAGHMIPGRKNAYLFHEHCVNGQCVNCNNNGGEGAYYYLAVVEKYGQQEADEIMALKNVTKKKYTVIELYDIEIYYKEKAKKLLADWEKNNL